MSKDRLVPKTTRERKVRRSSEKLPTLLYIDAEYGLVRDKQDLAGNDLSGVLRWCETHLEPVWVYNDGSYACPQEYVIEYDDGTHVIGNLPFDISVSVK